MTSEPDSTPRRRPPTIDLTAKEVESEPSDSAQKSAAGASAQDRMTERDGPSEPSGRSFPASVLPYALGALVGAIAAGIVIAGFWLAGFPPARETAAPPAAPVAETTAADEISSRLDKIQQALQAQRSEPRSDETLAPAARVAAAEAQTKALGDLVAALTRRVDEVAAASQSALAQAKAAAVAAEGAKNAAQAGVQRGEFDAFANRIAALESAIKALSAEMVQRTSSADDRAARATVAAAALRAAVERGTPYQAELAAVKTFGADESAIAQLAPFAAEGIPSAAALGRELTALTPALLRAAGVPSNERSFLGRLQINAQKLIRITPVDAPAGDDPSSVMARLNAEAARGDIAAALADIARLSDPARPLAEAWVTKAKAREQAIEASRRIAAAALAALGRPASQ